MAETNDHLKKHIQLESASAVVGAVSGIVTGLSKNLNATHIHGVAEHVANASAKFFHHATRSLVKNHKGVASLTGAAAAGTLAIAGPTVGPALVAAAPVVVVTVGVAGACYGVYRLVKFVKDL